MTSIPTSGLSLRQLWVRRPRAAGFVVATLVVVAGTYVAAALQPPNPRRVAPAPLAPAAVAPPGQAESIVFDLSTIDRRIAAFAGNLEREPRDFYSAASLISLYQARGRFGGDLADYDRALAAADRALKTAPGYEPARQGRAVVLFTLHDFGAALAAADALYRNDPTQLGALATRADAEIELGRLAAARTDLDRLSAASSGPAIDIRLARLAYVTGSPARALELAQQARDAAVAAGVDDLGFYEFALGEYARMAGQSDLAERAYQAARSLRATDAPAIVGLARIEASDGRRDAAITDLRRAAAIIPSPDALALLGDLLAMHGDGKGAQQQYATVRAIRQLNARAGAVYDRQLLLFELDHGGGSTAVLDSARAGLRLRDDAGAHDLVAWAAYRLGMTDVASAESSAALATGTADARLLYHAGAITLAAGDTAHGRRLLEEALALGPALDPLQADEARGLLGGD